jgi:hypothetical protein
MHYLDGSHVSSPSTAQGDQREHVECGDLPQAPMREETGRFLTQDKALHLEPTLGKRNGKRKFLGRCHAACASPDWYPSGYDQDLRKTVCIKTGGTIPQAGLINQQKRLRGVLLGPGNAIFKSTDSAHTVIIMTYEQLSVLKADGDKHGDFFSRIYLDEAQDIRRCRETERGRLLMALKVRSRWLFSGTLTQDGLEDLAGPISFLERTSWQEPEDRNMEDLRFVGFAERIEADDNPDPDMHAAPLSEDDWD